MKRFRLSTLMLLIVFAAVFIAQVVQYREAVRRKAELQAQLAEAVRREAELRAQRRKVDNRNVITQFSNGVLQ
jgi:cell division protein FtsB